MSLTNLAATLEKERKRRRLTHVELARLTGLSRLSVAHALAGRDHRVSTLLALAGQLGLAVELLPQEAVAGLFPGGVEVREDAPPMSLAESIRRQAADARARIDRSGR